MKKTLQFILKILALLVIRKYKPDIIGITGSVGKTSTKEAIYTVLKREFRVRRNIKSYNNQIGLPLTVLGHETAGKSLSGWLKVILGALGLILIRKQNFPAILILEMGADRPGDINYLVKVAPPKIGVVTALGEAHLEFFGSLDKIVEEKRTLLQSLGPDGFAIINGDDEKVLPMKERTKAQVLTFGFKDGVDLRALEVSAKWEEGINFKLRWQGSTVPVFLPQVLGRGQIYAALVAAACGVIYNINLIKISEALKGYQSPPGRTKLLRGIKNTIIIDDTYNACPVSMRHVLEIMRDFDLLEKFPQRREKFAVLGDMMELGSATEKAHKEIGEKVVVCGIDILITIGERSKDIAKAARAKGMDEHKIFSFAKAEEAGQFLQGRLEEGDLILIKGSQAMHLEKIVQEIMAEPLRAKELLVRQDESWLKKS